MDKRISIKVIFILMIGVAVLTTACSRKTYPKKTEVAKKETKKAVIKNESKKDETAKTSQPTDQLTIIKNAEKEADAPGKAVLETGRKMALIDKDIIKGSCWNWVNECFKRAGYGTDKHIAYKSKKSGPYVDIDKIKPGDWIYYINYSYNKVEHSGIFVYWVDKNKKIGVTLSYGGEHRKEPGRYREYLLKDVYYITRPGKK